MLRDPNYTDDFVYEIHDDPNQSEDEWSVYSQKSRGWSDTENKSSFKAPYDTWLRTWSFEERAAREGHVKRVKELTVTIRDQKFPTSDLGFVSY